VGRSSPGALARKEKHVVKPTLFIGSSSESLDIAYAAQVNLEDVADVIVWNQGLFELSRYFLESLLDALDETDFGLFVFAPDDLTKMRGREMQTARDNVIFELGLFIGRLGRERSFVIMPKGMPDFHLPSDLLGISTGTFEPPAKPERLQAALGPACHKVRQAIQKIRASEPSIANKEPREIDLMLPLVLPEPQRKHLINLAKGNTKGYTGRDSLRSELRHLRSMGLVQKLPGRNIGDMKSGMVCDLADYVELTDLGKRWAERLT
jgi:Predicted nucleotide-binding protein containing TIR-like domain